MNAPMNTPRIPSPLWRRVMPPALLATLLTTASCDDGTDPGSTDALTNWSLSDEPSVVIGGADEREDYLLHQVVGATRLADGRVVVANEGTLQLRYYDPEGEHLYDAGGQGEGPGEFESLSGIVRLPGDSVLVDSWLGLTRFGPDGRYASSIPYDLPPYYGECRWSVEGGQHPLADGSIVAVALVYVGIFGGRRCAEPTEAQPQAVVGRFIPTTGVFDTIAELPGLEAAYGDEMYAHAKNVVYAIGDERIYLGQTGSDTILAMSMTGDAIATLLAPFEPVPVPADAKVSGPARMNWIYPDHYPRYARIVAAPGDRVWVMAYPPLKEPAWYWELASPISFRRPEDGGALWRVLGPDGLVVAEVRTPEGFFLLEVGDDHVLGVHKDEFDRESVRLYRLLR